jgi:2-oxoglutarate dehydrogenase E2 component (dihydrolipoamide succinyltransferase)/2-oxoisovalerate dehydrogenase E2 component (dihydrolipoyl transacylase)
LSSRPITPPELGSPATFGLWLVRSGERVYAGDRLAELLIPGAVVDVPAAAGGTVGDQTARPGDPVGEGTVLGILHPDPDD